MIDIKGVNDNIILSVAISQDAIKTEELMKQYSITLSWNSITNKELPLGSYIVYDNVRYSLLEPYYPEQRDEATYEYRPVFQHPIMRLSKALMFFYTSANSRELDWTLTDNASNFMSAVCKAIKNEIGEDWTYTVASDLPASATLSFSNNDIFSALNTIAGAFETEWWFEYDTRKLHLSKAKFGNAVVLEVGNNIGVPQISKNKLSYYTRFYVFGSTRNINQNYSGAGVNSIVNRRLTLNPSKYPNGYIDVRSGLTGAEILPTALVFDDIYPRSTMTISDVRVRLMWTLDDKSQKVQIGVTEDGTPVYDQYAIWYFKIPGFTYDKAEMGISGKPLSVHFNTGPLRGREFELYYHNVPYTVESSDGVIFNVEEGDYEIRFVEEGTYIIPAITGLTPVDGNSVTLFNIDMPEEYKLSAYDELESAALSAIEKRSKDYDNYSFDSNKVAFYESNPNLAVGRSVTYINGSQRLNTRVIKLETKLDHPFEQNITIGNAQIKGTQQTLKEEVFNANQNIDLLSAINENTTTFQQALQRTQKAVLESIAKYGDWLGLDENYDLYVREKRIRTINEEGEEVEEIVPRNFWVSGEVASGGVGEPTEGGNGIATILDAAKLGTIATEDLSQTFSAFAVDSIYKRLIGVEQGLGAKTLGTLTNVDIAADAVNTESDELLVKGIGDNTWKVRKLSEIALNENKLGEYLTANGYLTKTTADENYASLTAFNTLDKKVNDFLSNEADVDETINRWKELEAFLAGYTETATLADLLKIKADASTVTTIQGYFDKDGNANNALKLGGNLPSYYATAESVSTLNSKIDSFNGRIKSIEDWFELKDGVLRTKYHLASDGEVSSGGIGEPDEGGDGGIGSILPYTSLASYGNTENLSEVFSAYTIKKLYDNLQTKITESDLWRLLGSGGSKININLIPDLSSIYLPLNGNSKTLNYTTASPLSINTTANSNLLTLGVIGTSKVEVGYREGIGAVLYNVGNNKYLGITDAGIATFAGNELFHKGNFNPADYLPLTGGTLTGALYTESSIYAFGAGKYIGIRGYLDESDGYPTALRMFIGKSDGNGYLDFIGRYTDTPPFNLWINNNINNGDITLRALHNNEAYNLWMDNGTFTFCAPNQNKRLLGLPSYVELSGYGLAITSKADSWQEMTGSIFDWIEGTDTLQLQKVYYNAGYPRADLELKVSGSIAATSAVKTRSIIFANGQKLEIYQQDGADTDILYLTGNLSVEGEVSSGGIGEPSTDDSFINLLTSWNQDYDETYALGANLGVELKDITTQLNSRIATLEQNPSIDTNALWVELAKSDTSKVIHSSHIPDLSGKYVTLDTSQTITANKSFNGYVFFHNYFYFDNDKFFYIYDSNKSPKDVFGLSASNVLKIGSGTAYFGYNTEVYGGTIRFRVYSADKNVNTPLVINSDGSISISGVTTFSSDVTLANSLIVNKGTGNARLYANKVNANTDYAQIYVSNAAGTDTHRPLVLQNGYGKVLIGTDTASGNALLQVNGGISATSATLSSTLSVTGNVSLGGALTGAEDKTLDWFGDVYGNNIRPQANVTYDLGSSGLRWKDAYINQLKIGDAVIYWDSENQCLRTDKSFSSDGELSSGGVGEEEADNIFNLLISWTGTYDESYALSAALGVNLNNRVSALENSSGGLDISAMWSALAVNDSTKVIHISHIPDLSSKYLTSTNLSNYTGSARITTVGTITSGTWQGTKIANTYLANSSVTISGKSVSLGGTITQSDLRSGLGLGSLAYKSSLVAADIPSLDWSKITSGKPTSLSGYGIADAYTKSETDAKYVTLATAQTISGAKTFSQGLTINGILHLKSALTGAEGMTLDWYGDVYGDNIRPQSDATYNLGSPNLRWKNAYVSDLIAIIGGTTPTLQIGDAVLYWDKENDCLRTNANFSADGEISSGGVGEEDSTEGGSNIIVMPHTALSTYGTTEKMDEVFSAYAIKEVSDHIDGVSEVLGKIVVQKEQVNLFQPNIIGKFYTQYGTELSGSNYYCQTVKVNPGDVLKLYIWNSSAYIAQTASAFAAYSNGVAQAAVGASKVAEYTVPSGIDEVRVGLATNVDISNLCLLKNKSEVPSVKTPYDDGIRFVTDETLTKEGVPADAKATGELNKKINELSDEIVGGRVDLVAGDDYTEIDGSYSSIGVIGYEDSYWHSSPILLKKGESIYAKRQYRGGTWAFVQVTESGEWIKGLVEVGQSLEHSYTATENMYISVTNTKVNATSYRPLEEAYLVVVGVRSLFTEVAELREETSGKIDNLAESLGKRIDFSEGVDYQQKVGAINQLGVLNASDTNFWYSTPIAVKRGEVVYMNTPYQGTGTAIGRTDANGNYYKPLVIHNSTKSYMANIDFDGYIAITFIKNYLPSEFYKVTSQFAIDKGIAETYADLEVAKKESAEIDYKALEVQHETHFTNLCIQARFERGKMVAELATLTDDDILAQGSCGYTESNGQITDGTIQWRIYKGGLLHISGYGKMYDFVKGTEAAKSEEEVHQKVRDLGAEFWYYGFVNENVNGIVPPFPQSNQHYETDEVMNYSNKRYVPFGEDINPLNRKPYGYSAPWYIYRVHVDDTYTSYDLYKAKNPNEITYNRILIEEDTGKGGITYIGNWAFYRVSADSLILPSSVTKIGCWGVRYSPVLKTLIMGDNITTIEDHGVSRMEAMEAVKVSSKLVSLGYEGMSADAQLKMVEFPDTTTSLGAFCFNGCGSLQIANFGSCQTMPRNFATLSSLVKVYIPITTGTIGANAFYKSNINRLVIPSNVSNIESDAFRFVDIKVVVIESQSILDKMTIQAAYATTQLQQGALIGRCDYILIPKDLIPSYAIEQLFLYIGEDMTYRYYKRNTEKVALN